MPSQRREFGNDIVRRLDQFRALANQLVAAAGQRIMDGARDREDLPALLRGQARGNQRAAAARGFDDERTEAEAADQPVPLREQRPVRRGAQRELADERAVLSNLPGEFA